MATAGTAFEGMDFIIAPAVYTGIDMRLYTNAGNSLTSSTILSGLTFPVGTGYATYTLSGVWSSTNGQITYDDGAPDDVLFENTGLSTWTGGDVVGVALTDGTYLLHWKDLSTPVTMTPGALLQVDLSTFIS